VAAVLRDYGGKPSQAGRARKNGSTSEKKDPGLAWKIPKPQWKIAVPQSKITPPRWKGSAS